MLSNNTIKHKGHHNTRTSKATYTMSRERRRPPWPARGGGAAGGVQSKYILCMLFYVTSRRGELCSLTPTTDPPRTVTQSRHVSILPARLFVIVRSRASVILHVDDRVPWSFGEQDFQLRGILHAQKHLAYTQAAMVSEPCLKARWLLSHAHEAERDARRRGCGATVCWWQVHPHMRVNCTASGRRSRGRGHPSPADDRVRYALAQLGDELECVAGVLCLLLLALPTRVVARQAGGSFTKTASRTFTGVWTTLS